MEDEWDMFVVPHIAQVVKKLQPSLILDHLRGERLLTGEEYDYLWNEIRSETKRARILVNTLLPRKGKDSLDKFCSILLKIPGQEHIVKDIIKYEPTSEASRQNEAQCDTTFSASPSPVMTQELPISHYGSKEPKYAKFVFREEHRESIDDIIQSIICSMCRKLFGINKKHVEFQFDDNPGKKGYICYSDLQNKLVVLKVHGASPDRVRLYRKKLIRCIVSFLDQHRVKRRQVLFRESGPGCSFIILSVDIDSFIDLLCLLGQEETNGAKELGVAVQRAIPGLQKGNLFLGGLPAIELFSEPLERVQSTQPPFSLKRQETICAMFRKVLDLQESVFLTADLITDELEKIKREVPKLREGKLFPCQILEYETSERLKVVKQKLTDHEQLQFKSPREYASVTETLQRIKRKHEKLLNRVEVLSLTYSQQTDIVRSKVAKQELRAQRLVKGHADITEDQLRLAISGHKENTGKETADTEELERTKQEVLTVVGTGERRRPKVGESHILAIDLDRLGYGRRVGLKKTKFRGKGSRFFRIFPEFGVLREPAATGSDHIGDLMRQVEKVLHEIRREANERPDGSLQIDLWVHLGHVLLENVDITEAVSVQTVLSNVNKHKKWKAWFDGGVTSLDMNRLQQLLAKNPDVIQSSVRHDIGIFTPSGKHRRFKVWIPEQSTTDSGAQQVSGVPTGIETSRGVGSGLLKVGPGILVYPLNARLKADVALPGHPFDCRLQIKTGISDLSQQDETDKFEDATLIREFCGKVRIISKKLFRPPDKKLKKLGYKLAYSRKSKRTSYRLKGFELTISEESSVSWGRPEEQKIDLHIHSIACESLLDKSGGREWTPQEIARLIPQMLRFVKENISNSTE